MVEPCGSAMPGRNDTSTNTSKITGSPKPNCVQKRGPWAPLSYTVRAGGASRPHPRPFGELAAGDVLVGRDVTLAGCLDDLARQAGRRWRLVPARRLQPVAHR